MPGGKKPPGKLTELQAMDQLYSKLVKNLGWPLNQIDDTDFETLMDYLFFKDPDVRIVNGKEYRRAQSVPAWL